MRWFAVSFASLFVLSASAAPELTRAAGTTLTISQGVDADTLNPIATTITPTFNVVQHFYERLADFDSPHKLKPVLAVSWRRVDPTTEEYKLRPNVKFSNGDPFTSADVRYTVEWIKNPANKSAQTVYVRDIDRVETPDPLTVRFISKVPTAIPPGQTNPIYIVDSKYFQEKGNAYASQHPIGTGAYVLTEWRRDDATIMDANPGWWNGKPHIDRVIFKPIADAATRVAALKTGQVDLITNVPPQNAASIEEGRTTKLASARSLRQVFFAFNVNDPGPQQKRLVRQALNYAVNVDAIIKTVMGGHAFRLNSALPPQYFGYNPTIKAYTYDPAKAKELLAKAGFPNGNGIDLLVRCPTGRYSRDKEVCEAIAGQLTAIGVKATARPQEWTSYYGELNTHKTGPLYMLGWNAPVADADAVYSALFESNAPLSNYKNEAVDRLIEDARGELNVIKRQAIYEKTSRILHDEAPWIFLFQFEDLYGVNKRVVWQPRGDEYIRAYDMSIH